MAAEELAVMGYLLLFVSQTPRDLKSQEWIYHLQFKQLEPQMLEKELQRRWCPAEVNKQREKQQEDPESNCIFLPEIQSRKKKIYKVEKYFLKEKKRKRKVLPIKHRSFKKTVLWIWLSLKNLDHNLGFSMKESV